MEETLSNFFAKLKGFKVLSQTSKSKSIKLTHDSVLKLGVYHHDIIYKNNTVKVRGRFTTM
jgi:hypothetical protein